MDTEQITARVSSEVRAWLKEQSQSSGVSVNQAVTALLTEAMRQGWTVHLQTPAGVKVPDPRGTKEDG